MLNMSIFKSIWHYLKRDLRKYWKTRIGRKVYRKYWLDKESAKLAHNLSQDIDEQLENFKKLRDNQNTKTNIRTSQKQ